MAGGRTHSVGQSATIGGGGVARWSGTGCCCWWRRCGSGPKQARTWHQQDESEQVQHHQCPSARTTTEVPRESPSPPDIIPSVSTNLCRNWSNSASCSVLLRNTQTPGPILGVPPAGVVCSASVSSSSPPSAGVVRFHPAPPPLLFVLFGPPPSPPNCSSAVVVSSSG